MTLFKVEYKINETYSNFLLRYYWYCTGRDGCTGWLKQFFKIADRSIWLDSADNWCRKLFKLFFTLWSLFYYYPPSSGISSCIRTYWVVMCLHTWRSPLSQKRNLSYAITILELLQYSSIMGLPDSAYAQFNIVGDPCHPVPYYLNSEKPFLTLSDWYHNPERGFEPGT